MLLASVYGTWDEFDECVDRDGDYNTVKNDASSSSSSSWKWSSWCHMIIHDDYGDKEVEAGDDCHLLASNPFLTQQGHCQAWSGQPACMPCPNWLKRFVSKLAWSTKIHQFNARAVDQMSSLCDLFEVELNRIEKLDNPSFDRLQKFRACPNLKKRRISRFDSNPAQQQRRSWLLIYFIVAINHL